MQHMKKKYSLDYSIERDVDRLHAIENILDTLESNPSPSELEQMASYILYGKDEEGKNSVQRGETTDSDKRYKSFQRIADKNQSLDEILENPLADQQNFQSLDSRSIYTKKKPVIARPKYDKIGNLIDPGDSDIPGMQKLWDLIDYLDHTIAVNDGKVEPDENTQIFTDSYRYYQFKHMVIDVKKHQYYLKDSYKPTVHFVSTTISKTPTYNWDADTFYWISLDEWQKRVDNALLHTISKNLEDYETRTNDQGEIEIKWVVRRHKFDWENPQHIKALINHYSALHMQLDEKMDSWGRTLLYDFDRYFDMAHFTPVREYILTRKIDKAPYPQIVAELQEKFGLHYNENHICTILAKEIPEKMATTATKHRMLLTTPQEERKCCFTCKQWLPRNNYFFATNNSRKDKFASNCKECERKKRIAKGGQSEYDKRNKDTQMFKMSSGKT